MYTIPSWIYIFLDIQIFCKSRESVHLVHKSSCWIYAIIYIFNVSIQIFYKYRQSIHLMHTISRLIYAILYIQHIYRIQTTCKSKQSIHLMYTISSWIYAILDNLIFCKSKKSVCLLYSRWIFAIMHIQCTQFSFVFAQLWIFKSFANPYNLYI